VEHNGIGQPPFGIGWNMSEKKCSMDREIGRYSQGNSHQRLWPRFGQSV